MNITADITLNGHHLRAESAHDALQWIRCDTCKVPSARKPIAYYTAKHGWYALGHRTTMVLTVDGTARLLFAHSQVPFSSDRSKGALLLATLADTIVDAVSLVGLLDLINQPTEPN